MSLFKCTTFRCTTWISLLLISSNAIADGYVIGIGADGDSAGGRSVAAIADFSIGERTWLSLAGGSTRTDGVIRDNETMIGGLGVDVFFDPVGFRLGGAYWGDPDILDSRDARASIYLKGDVGSLSLDYEKRNFEFDLQSDLLRGNTVTFSADGWGFSSRLAFGEKVSIFAGGMRYDYSRNLRIQQDVDVLAFISRSRLSMINSLIDDYFNAGLEFEFGLRSIDVTATQWQTAIDGSTIDSYSIGFLTPVSDRFDAEFRISFDESETFGRATALSVYLYYFGGL